MWMHTRPLNVLVNYILDMPLYSQDACGTSVTVDTIHQMNKTCQCQINNMGCKIISETMFNIMWHFFIKQATWRIVQTLQNIRFKAFNNNNVYNYYVSKWNRKILGTFLTYIGFYERNLFTVRFLDNNGIL